MSNTQEQIIFHAYPQSPVAEKVRVAFGVKKLNWCSVEIPRLPPKPMLTTLTGGYRRTPVMQIGADIYCDSYCIIEELEKVVLGSAGDALPEDFAEDRGRLYLGGDNWAENLKRANAQLPHLVSQLSVTFSWLDQVLDDGRKYLTGDQPSALDAQVYHVVWFIHGRFAGGEALIANFPNLARWQSTVELLGHGTSSVLSAEEAIKIAASATPQTKQHVEKNDPVESGEQFVSGTVRYADKHRIAIDRTCEDTDSTVCVHFPRAGYRIDV